jgi:hypothetical protein
MYGCGAFFSRSARTTSRLLTAAIVFLPAAEAAAAAAAAPTAERRNPRRDVELLMRFLLYARSEPAGHRALAQPPASPAG